MGSKTGTKQASACSGGPCSWLGNANRLFTLFTALSPGQSCLSVLSPAMPGRGRTGVLASGAGKGTVDVEVVAFAVAATVPEPALAKLPAALSVIPGESKRMVQIGLLAG